MDAFDIFMAFREITESGSDLAKIFVLGAMALVSIAWAISIGRWK